MGIEAFDIELSDSNKSIPHVLQHLLSLPCIHEVKTERSRKDTNYLVYEDGRHVVELKLSNEGHPTVHCRFALCNPPSVDTVVAALLLAVCAKFPFKITILDDVPEGDSQTFLPPAYEQFPEVLARTAAVRRAEWQTSFGNVEAGVTTTEALHRFVR